MCVFHLVRHISFCSDYDWCCMCLMGEFKLCCMSVTTHGSHGLREPQLRLGDVWPHLYTHFLYSAHVHVFVHFCDLHPHIIPLCMLRSSVVFMKIRVLQHIFQPPSPSLSAPFFPKHCTEISRYYQLILLLPRS